MRTMPQCRAKGQRVNHCKFTSNLGIDTFDCYGPQLSRASHAQIGKQGP